MMQFEERYEYPMDLDSVWSMYSDPAFTKDRLAQAKLADVNEKVSAQGNDITVEVAAVVPSSLLPAAAKRFVPEKTSVTLTEQWRRTGEHTAEGTTTLKVNGVPVSLAAKSVLQSTGTTTVRTMSGDLKVGIPLLGKRLEREAISFVPKLVQAEVAAAQDWQAKR